MNGYIPPQRTREIEATFEAAEGAEPFRATIVTSLTFAEVDAIPLEDARWKDIFKAIAPYVLAWNAMARNVETGEYEPVPPPAEAGPDVFQLVPPDVTVFLAVKLKTAHLGDKDERPKESAPSDDTPDGRHENSTASTTKTAKPTRRKSRTSLT